MQGHVATCPIRKIHNMKLPGTNAVLTEIFKNASPLYFMGYFSLEKIR